MYRQNSSQIGRLKQPPLFCSNCRTPESQCSTPLTKCPRCQLKRYCCQKCKNDDSGSHEGYCINLERMRKHCETYPSHPQGVLSHQMGNLIFHVAYRTTDISNNFAHEAALFAESLQFYREAYTKYSQSGRVVQHLEDQMLVLYVALGHDEAAFQEIYRFLTVSSPLNSIENAKEPHLHDDILKLLSAAQWRPSLLTLLLLLKMRLLARLRQLEAKFDHYQRTSGGLALDEVHSVVRTFLLGDANSMDSQEKQIQRLLARIPTICQAICNARPLTHLQAPGLFHCIVSPEYWQILQDCFLAEPGVENIVREYALSISGAGSNGAAAGGILVGAVHSNTR